jgi:sulfide:quinone oxidoreductase
MARIVVLGGGTAGTIVANKLRRRLDPSAWDVTVVDRDGRHLYQPGLLLLPFGLSEPDDLVKDEQRLLDGGIELRLADVDRVEPQEHQVRLGDGTTLDYDVLVIATGTSPRPEETPGMTGPGWRRTVHEFFTLEGAVALRDALGRFQGGRLVVHVVEMPVKCPVAPLEFAFLADAHFAERGLREQVDITYVTPLDGAFTKPVAASHLGTMLGDRGIALETDFVVDRVDGERGCLVSMDDREVPFDLLVTVPLNMGADFVARSGFGDELNYVAVDKHTLQADVSPDVFVIGDASDIPTSKAGSVAHFSADVVVENVLSHVDGQPLAASFDGHANCFIESGHGKALLLDFDYETEPLPGRYPLPGVGPFTLLEESHVNHWGKLGFRWAYWHLLVRGRPMPVPSAMSMAGKSAPAPTG